LTWLDTGATQRLRWLGRRNRGAGARDESHAPASGQGGGQSEEERRNQFEAQALPHANALYRTAYHLSRHAAEAEDLTQETYLRAYRAYSDFRGGDIRAWLFTILRHAFLDECRRRGRQPVVEIDSDDPDALESMVSTGSLVPSAETEALHRLPSEEIERAIASLPEEWRMMILLADVEDFSYREIAETMGIPMGTVMSRLHRARKRLHDMILESAQAH
jgi:RNA polymerase sigma-70 factor, ECF subfamily